MESTFSQTLHFTFGTPTLFGLQSSFGLSLLSSLPPLSCAVSWLSRRRRRRSKLVATRRCLARQNSFLSFPVTLGVGARSSGVVVVVVHMELFPLGCVQVTPHVCRAAFEHLHVKHLNQPDFTSVSPACDPSLFSCCSNLQQLSDRKSFPGMKKLLISVLPGTWKVTF